MAIVLGSTGVAFNDGAIQTQAAYDTFRTSQTFLTSGSWTCPAGIVLVQVSIIGGGGAGGTGASGNFSNTTFYAGGGGGGSGAIIWNYRVAVTPTTVYTVTVGGSTVASSFGALMTVNAGASGANATNGQTPGAGGAGGAAYNFGAVSTSAIARFETALAPVSTKGGNGSQGGVSTANTVGGNGGTTPLPIGSYTGGTTPGGAATANTGAGGAGGNSGQAGGAGGSGLVIIQY